MLSCPREAFRQASSFRFHNLTNRRTALCAERAVHEFPAIFAHRLTVDTRTAVHAKRVRAVVELITVFALNFTVQAFAAARAIHRAFYG